jgi:DNA polymerase III epsilon subunit-like protein
MAKGINSFVFLDFETGGLDAKIHAVTEIAAIAITGDTLKQIDIMSTFIQPYGKEEVTRDGKLMREFDYTEGAMKSTGITMEDINGGIPVTKAVDELIELFKKADLGGKYDKPFLLAHNSAFDKAFLIQIFKVAGKLKELAKLVYGKEDYYGNFQPEMLDTVILSKMAWGNDGDVTNYKLISCITKAGVELSDAHKAINDTIGLKDMGVVLINKLRSTGVPGDLVVKDRFRNHFQF